MDNKLISSSATKFCSYYPGAMLTFFILYFSVGKWFGIGAFSWAHVWPVILLGTLPALWLVVENMVKLWAGIVLLFGIGLVHLFAGAESLGKFYKEYGSWLQGSVSDAMAYSGVYLGLQLVWMVLCGYILWLCILHMEWLKAVLCIAVPVTVVVLSFTRYELSAKAVLFLLVLWLYLLTYFTARFWKKNGESARTTPRTKESMVFLAPAFLLLLLIMLLLPEKREAFQWDFVRDFVQRTKEQVITWVANWDVSVGQNDFTLSFDGFSKEATLKGKANGDGKACLNLNLEAKPECNLYLTESIWNDFDGREWKIQMPLSIADSRLDLMETLYAVNRCEVGSKDDYLRQSHVKAQMRYFHTDHELFPLKTVYVGQQQNLLSDNMYGYGSGYEARFYKLNLSHPLFTALLEAGTDLPEDTAVWEKLSYSMREGSKEVSLDQLHEYQDAIYRTYSETEDRITDEAVEAWLDEAVGEAESDYQKLLRLEEAMWKLQYTTSPGEMPLNVTDANSFLHYLLLDKKEGFCTYYATAFVLLSRHLGLPARYCRGFMVPSKGLEQVTVYTGNMHAWPEVYFKGIGWIPFEPTPGFGGTRYTPWAEKKMPNSKEDIDWSDFTRHMDELNAAKDAAKAKEEETEKPFFDPQLVMTTGKIALGILLIAVFMILLAYGFLAHIGTSMAKSSKEKQFQWLYRHCQNGYGRFGLVREQDETLREFECRLQKAGLNAVPIQVQNALSYSSYALTEEDLDGCLKALDALLLCLQEQKQGRLYRRTLSLSKYWYSKSRKNGMMK